MGNDEDVGKRLAQYRLDRALRQADVAKALGVTQQTIGNWESGKPPKGARLAQLRIYLAGGHEYVGDVPPVKLEAPLFFGHENVQRRIRELEQEFVEVLPEDLRQYAQVSVPFAGYVWRPDYLSPKVCAELKVIQTGKFENSISYHVERSLLDLSTIRAIHILQGAARDTYALLLIGPHPDGRWGHARLQSASAAHGITIYVQPDQYAAAALVADLEYGPIE